MEKAWNIITSKDASVPKVHFNKHDREIRETNIDHASFTNNLSIEHAFLERRKLVSAIINKL